MGIMRLGVCSFVFAALSMGACAPGSESGAAAEAPQLTGAQRAAAIVDEATLLLDVREPSELEELGTVEGYVNIPIDQLADRLDELPRDKPILTL